ncbi:MAG: DUF1573 domain-containing protein [bacterium]|nr:DUF1573 domain-containing protein [bacterium]
MKKIKFILALFFLISGLAVIGYFKAIPGADGGGDNPKIEMSPATFDFGDIQYGQIVEYDFTVKNTGKSVLEIKRVATSCSCTTAKISQETITPGETVNLRVRYDSGAMGLAHGKGRQERVIYIRSNDPVTPQTESMIFANVK